MRTLRRELLVPTALLALTAVAALAYLAWDTAVQARTLEQSAVRVRAATALAFALGDAVHDEEHAVLEVRGRAAAVDEIRVAEASARVDDLMREIRTMTLEPRAGRVWDRLVDARASMLESSGQVLSASRAGDETVMLAELDRWRVVSGRADALLKDFTAFHLRLLDRTVADLQGRRVRSLWLAAAAVLAGFLVATAFAIVVARRIVRPIAAIAAAAERMSPTGPPVRVAGGERPDEIGVLARSINDMAERLVAANAQLAESVRTRDEFISIASHELRTPLTPLMLRAQQLGRAAADESVPREQLVARAHALARHVARMGKLVQSLLDVSRVTAGRLPLAREPFAVADAIRDAVEGLADDLAAARCEVRVELADGVRVRGDRSRVEQVLANLLGNAAKYAPGGPVRVRVAEDGADVVVEIEDAGPGVAEADRERIFGRFERAVEDPIAVSGLGLGLYIAREIVRAHGGELTVRPGSERGATFVVRLPRDGAPADAGAVSG